MHSTSDEPYKYLYRALTILYRTLDLIWNGLLDYYTVHSNVKMNENFFFFFQCFNYNCVYSISFCLLLLVSFITDVL